ncbi:MAG: sulfatase-like hydrolase/transferase, partial [Bacilli bacterium]|nr:sulfatase-like hydrolase/transferase [Bacilli bacterium]
EIWDLNNAIHEGYMTSDDIVFWGFSDKELFMHAKDKLNSIKDYPFNLTLLTVNTHNPNGYIDDSCNIENDDIYAKSILCSNKYLKDFIEWVQNSEFYSNTTIVLAGDHLTMNTSLLKKLSKEYDRTVYFTIINSPLEYNANRLFTTYDIFPTTLASLNVEIEGNRLGLGTNLYSDTKTLLEIYGIEYMNKELYKKSTFYPKLFK